MVRRLGWIVFSASLYLCCTAQVTTPSVDLEYGLYTGIFNSSSGLNIWRGIRYAAPPVGSLRWQKPRVPAVNRSPIAANAFGPACPQAMPSMPGMPFISGNEDCLFLNVYAPAVKPSNSSLPVLVVIHGGGYGAGDGTQDMAPFISTNGNDLVAVTIQYRLGAFGFLASPEVKSRGVLNAGLLDQQFALQWVQKHIAKFGGDSSRVTIAGESAGGGSVLLHAISQGGDTQASLFKNLIAASPWIPTQPYYNDTITSRHYNDFASLVGCPSRGAVFDCLVSKDSLLLQYAANIVSTNKPTPHGNWAFIPVTDGSYITGPPSTELFQSRTNGQRLLVGNNANEGSLIPPSNVVTQPDLIAWIKSNFPNLSDTNVTNILAEYPSTGDPVDPAAARYETDGYGPGTAVNISQVATGQQQRCYASPPNIYAEASVICPSYWFASSFAGNGRAAYHYQYSVPFAVHGADISGYYGPPTENQSPDFVSAFRKIYGNFVKTGDPSLSNLDANGRSSLNPSAPNPASNWPPWSGTKPVLINLNETGGTPYTIISSLGTPVTQFRGPGLHNNFTTADAYAWEGGRGRRCEFWRKISPFVPQ
ncbi:Alpha/Beta hydrolase protein [Lasiosphaeris hirsuta]|uniref:Carboxylic ester hydrolase n=1 Tax=Lasiosphaeris hirsuta TaxID=260670 RepID=A0AA40A1M8_9PEZI|nr:Alpha/Beta hydrolase protein [Lasiosphaeris hirsuta]